MMLGAAAPREAVAETLPSALAKAYQSNPQLNAQRAIVRQNDEGVAQALSGYRPTLSANASVVSDKYGPLRFSTSLPSTGPNSAVTMIAAGMPSASGTCQ